MPLLDRAYEALVAPLREEQAKGLGSESDFVFTSLKGRPLGRDHLSKRGVLGAATRAGLGHVTAQTLPRSVATATAHAQGSSGGGSGDVGAQPGRLLGALRTPVPGCRRALEGAEVVASIGFGNSAVDQPVNQGPI